MRVPMQWLQWSKWCRCSPGPTVPLEHAEQLLPWSTNGGSTGASAAAAHWEQMLQLSILYGLPLNYI